MKPEVLIGLIALFCVYLGAIFGFVWLGSKRIRWAERHGIAMGPKPSFPGASDIWNRHSVEASAIFAVFFLALAFADFPIWQMVGIATLLALGFGSMWLQESPNQPSLATAPYSFNAAMSVGYWILAVLDWLGYLGSICLAAALVVELIH